MSVLEKVLTYIAPHECVGCGGEGAVLCQRCLRLLPEVVSACYRCGRSTKNFATCKKCRVASPLRSVHVSTAYEGVAKQAVWRLKFDRAQAASKDLARAMGVADASPQTIFVHIPTATTRVRTRGYDQAKLITSQLAHSNHRIHQTLLVRHGQKRQVGLSGTERRKQLEGAFRVVHSQHVRGAHIVLVDDVLTTGATLEAAARVLKAAGAKRVDATVFARA